MAEYEKVEINDNTPSENITLEEEAAAIDAKATENPEAVAEGTTPEVSEDRPEWLPEKFQSAEDMANAYAELEGKQSGGEEADTSEQEATESTEEETAQVSTIEDATAEFATDGQLSETTYEKLAEVGLGKDMVDQYIAGQEAIIEQQSQAIFSEIGGKSEYEAMSEWAGESLSDADLTAYNETVESGTVDQAKFAVKALYAQYKGGAAPKPMQGSTNGAAIAPFASRAQVTEAMRSKQYTEDPAYRNQVEQRLAISNI
jgi:hypothetical protein